jgi:hypothetical protein
MNLRLLGGRNSSPSSRLVCPVPMSRFTWPLSHHYGTACRPLVVSSTGFLACNRDRSHIQFLRSGISGVRPEHKRFTTQLFVVVAQVFVPSTMEFGSRRFKPSFSFSSQQGLTLRKSQKWMRSFTEIPKRSRRVSLVISSQVTNPRCYRTLNSGAQTKLIREA